MESLILEGNKTLPNVILDAENGYFELSGKSVPMQAEEFYSPILNWLEDYLKHPKSFTRFIFKLDYFNIASSKRILFILYKLKEIQGKGLNVVVSWYFEEKDDSMLESGKDFAFMVDVPFEFSSYKHPVLETSVL